MSAAGGGALLLEHVCSSNKGSLSITDIYLPPNCISDNATVCETYKQFVIISAVRIVFFLFKSNRIVELLFEISNQIVIVGLKSHQ